MQPSAGYETTRDFDVIQINFHGNGLSGKVEQSDEGRKKVVREWTMLLRTTILLVQQAQRL